MTRSNSTPGRHLPAVVRALKAMAHPARLRMLAMLATGELCVCQITAVLELAASTVSGHLADLRAAGLVIERKQGKWVRYRLTEDPGALALITSALAPLAADNQTGSDAAVVRHVRRIPVETLSGAGLDVAAITAADRVCCPPKSLSRRARAARAASL